MEVRKNTVEFVERIPGDHQTTLARLAGGFDRDLGTEGLGESIFEVADVGILAPVSAEGGAGQGRGRTEVGIQTVIFLRWIDQPANQCLSFSN